MDRRRRTQWTRRGFGRMVGASALALPFVELVGARETRAADGSATRAIFFYFPDGIAGRSQSGQPSLWHPTGSENSFSLSEQLQPLQAFKDDCVFLNGLTMGGFDSGSHPGGAKKLLTARDNGDGESIDQFLSRTAGASSPFRHVYLGAMANQNNASGDKHISYPSGGQSVAPEDDPRRAFDLLFGGIGPNPGPNPDPGGGPDPRQVSVIDAVLDDTQQLRDRLGDVERTKLDLHLESVREVEKRIKDGDLLPPSCDDPSVDTTGVIDGQLYDPARFPAILKAQVDVMVMAMACGLTQVGTIQASHHTSELVMSQFPGTEMFDPNFDMRSHQASHYGASHDQGNPQFVSYVQQRRWFVEQFAYLLQQLADRPEPTGDGSMLDHSVILLCSEVSDGNTHLHDDMPFVLAGRAGGAISTGRLLQYGGAAHGDLLAAIAHAMGEPVAGFGQGSGGPLSGLLG